MMTAYEKITVLTVHFHITATHTANPLLVHWLKVSVRQNVKCFHAFICDFRTVPDMPDDGWFIVTAKMDYKFNRAYGRKGPVLTAESAEPCEAPDPSVATFF